MNHKAPPHLPATSSLHLLTVGRGGQSRNWAPDRAPNWPYVQLLRGLQPRPQWDGPPKGVVLGGGRWSVVAIRPCPIPPAPKEGTVSEKGASVASR